MAFFYVENSLIPPFNIRPYAAVFFFPLESCHPDPPDDQSMDIHSLFHLSLAPLLTLESLHIILLLSLPRIRASSAVLLLHTASRCISSQVSLPDGSRLSCSSLLSSKLPSTSFQLFRQNKNTPSTKKFDVFSITLFAAWGFCGIISFCNMKTGRNPTDQSFVPAHNHRRLSPHGHLL